MAKLYKAGRFIGGNAIGGNSVTLADGDLVSKVGGFIVKSTNSTGEVIGITAGEQTFASDNQTVDKVRAQFIEADESTRYKIAITGGTITQVDEGKFYNLNGSGIVDGTTESAIGAYVNTSDTGGTTDAVVKMQLKLEKFISATSGIFSVNR